MTTALEPILRTALETIGWACIFIRNQTIREGASPKMINDAMEAIHEVPRMLTHWRPDTLQEVRTHFGCFHAPRWPGAPDLVAYFEDRLKQHGHDQNTG